MGNVCPRNNCLLASAARIKGAMSGVGLDGARRTGIRGAYGFLVSIGVEVLVPQMPARTFVEVRAVTGNFGELVNGGASRCVAEQQAQETRSKTCNGGLG